MQTNTIALEDFLTNSKYANNVIQSSRIGRKNKNSSTMEKIQSLDGIKAQQCIMQILI